MLIGASATAFAAQTNDTLAGRLVTQAMASHPQASEIGISVRTSSGCHSIASSDPSDVGERCESGDLRVMRTHHGHAVKERDGYDVSVPLHDSAGRLIGSLAVEFRLQSQQNTSAAIRQAEAISRHMAGQISSQASLTRR
jgi:hypothetical protein